MKKIICVLIFLASIAGTAGQTKFQKDFGYYWQTINDNFAYFDKQKTNWQKAKFIYQPLADSLKTKAEFISLLEAANNELYNGHVFLNVNTGSSNKTIPTGADLKIEFINSQFIISEIRPYFNVINYAEQVVAG